MKFMEWTIGGMKVGENDENEAEDQSDSDGVAESELGEEDNTGASGKDEGNDSERSE